MAFIAMLHISNHTYTRTCLVTLASYEAARLEAVQRRAISIIFVIPPYLLYACTLAVIGIPSLQTRRLDHGRHM